jgi:hypothetical protein
LSGGERDLSRLLKDLRPRLRIERFAFRAASVTTLQAGDFALVREDEGVTAIRQDPAGEWACITLDVHSSLHAVGLTAALSSRLTEAGITANIVAGLNHDHLFVPWDRRDDALDCLSGLAA